jgi:hypothetical protein
MARFSNGKGANELAVQTKRADVRFTPLAANNGSRIYRTTSI